MQLTIYFSSSATHAMAAFCHYRYLEKRKNRTFQKTIRYASRKAYAEVCAVF